MLYYFQLQARMINRQLAEYGVYPALGLVLIAAAFVAFSLLLFDRIAYAGYLYILSALSPLSFLGEAGRNQFLRTCFSLRDYRKVRLIENLLVILPFLVFLLFRMDFLQAFILLILALILSFATYGKSSGFIIPTPFSGRPFEFPVGFRKSFLAVLLAVFLAVMAIASGNVNLGIGAVILMFLICITFYINPEEVYYIWIFHFSPVKFLLHKIGTAMLYSTFLSLPVTITLAVFFPESVLALAGFQALGYIYLIAVILAKYSAFPHQLSVPQFVILGLTLWLPPLLFAVIPFFYLRSVKQLKPILG